MNSSVMWLEESGDGWPGNWQGQSRDISFRNATIGDMNSGYERGNWYREEDSEEKGQTQKRGNSSFMPLWCLSHYLSWDENKGRGSHSQGSDPRPALSIEKCLTFYPFYRNVTNNITRITHVYFGFVLFFCFFYLCHRAKRLSSVDCFSVAFPTKPCCCSLRSATSSSSCWHSPSRLVADDRAASRGLSCSTDWQISWMEHRSGTRVVDPQCNRLVHLNGMFQNTVIIKLLYDQLI